MKQYPKIQSVYKRYTEGPKKGEFIKGDWSLPEFEYLKTRYGFGKKRSMAQRFECSIGVEK